MGKRLYGLSIVAILMLSTYPPAHAKNLITLKIGQTFVFNVTDGVGNTWEYKIDVSGKASLGGKTYFIVDALGYESPLDYQLYIERSISKAVYQYIGFSSEILGLQNAPVGTTWTYTDEQGREIKKTIEAIETVTVPAGTFSGCLRFFHECISCDPIVPFTREWVMPGFFTVKEIDYATDNAPKVKLLKSY